MDVCKCLFGVLYFSTSSTYIAMSLEGWMKSIYERIRADDVDDDVNVLNDGILQFNTFRNGHT